MRPGAVDLANLPRSTVLYEAAIASILEAHDAAIREVLSRRCPGPEAAVVRLSRLNLPPSDPDAPVVLSALDIAAMEP